METGYFPYPCGQEIMGCKIVHKALSWSNNDSMVKRILFNGK